MRCLWHWNRKDTWKVASLQSKWIRELNRNPKIALLYFHWNLPCLLKYCSRLWKISSFLGNYDPWLAARIITCDFWLVNWYPSPKVNNSQILHSIDHVSLKSLLKFVNTFSIGHSHTLWTTNSRTNRELRYKEPYDLLFGNLSTWLIVILCWFLRHPTFWHVLILSLRRLHFIIYLQMENQCFAYIFL